MSRLSIVLCAVLAFSWQIQLGTAYFHRHDASFVPDFVLEVTEQNITLDCHTRYSVVYNGTSPGPALYLTEGQVTWVRVYNNMPDKNFTTHWHGLSMRAAVFSDGSPYSAQWPIAPGEFFDYEIYPQIGEAGSYFYHSHEGFQAVTAHGPLIVEDAKPPPYHWDEEILVAFADFYQANDTEIEDGLLASPFQWSGEPQALLMNGASGNLSFSEATDASCAPAIFDINPGETYRIRILGRTAITLVTMAFEDHDNLTIIEADGKYTKPYSVDHMQIGTGQRFSILFTAKTEEELMAAGNKTEYWMRYESRARPDGVSGYALVRYRRPWSCSGSCPGPHPGSDPTSYPGPRPGTGPGPGPGSAQSPAPLPDLPYAPPMTLPDTVTDWLEYALETLDPPDPFPALSEVTRTVYITVKEQMENGTYYSNNGSVDGVLDYVENNLTWKDNELSDENFIPLLIRLYTNQAPWPNYTAALNNYGWDPATKTFPALVGEVLDIVWLSNSGPRGGWEFHPMHAHGKHYWDLGAGNGTYDAVENEKKFANYTPAIRDTTMLYAYASSGGEDVTAGWRAWRIRVTEDNVGTWLMHCHILQHIIMGMQSSWTFGSREQVLAKFPEEPYVAGYLNYGGSAYGNDSFDPLVNHQFEGAPRGILL